MTTVNLIDPLASSGRVAGVSAAAEESRAEAARETVPEAALNLAQMLSELPTLPPAGAHDVSLDTLLKAVAEETRRNSVQGAADQVENQAEAIDRENQKQLEELRKQIAEQSKQSGWQKFLSFFKIIGTVVAAIAGIATTVVGAMTANPLLVAVGVTGTLMAIDSTLSLATDGKVSIAAGFTALGKAMGMSDEAAKWFGFGMNIAVVAVGIAASFGAAAASSGAATASKVAEMGSNAAKALSGLSKISSASNVASGVTGVGAAVGSAALAVIEYRLAKIEANKVDINAVLEQLRAAIKVNEDLIEAELQASESLFDSVKDIVEDCARTSTAIQTLSPATA